MPMEVKRKNLKEDFKLLVSLSDSYEGYRFKLIFTSGKYGNIKYVCSFDGTEYKNCLMADDTHVLCLMNNHGLPCGLVSVETIIYIPDEQMPDGDNKKSDKRLFEFPYNGRNYHLELTNGKSDDLDTPEVLLDILGTVIKGERFKFEDFTEEQIEELQRPAMEAVEGKQDTLESGKNIKTINGQSIVGEGNIVIDVEGGFIAPDGGVKKADLSLDVQSSLNKADTALQSHQDISGKQDVIEDLNTIRAGASSGSTAVQPSLLEGYETKAHASATYQPIINDLATIRQNAEKGNTAVQPSAISDMETKTNAANTYATKTEIATMQNVYAVAMADMDERIAAMAAMGSVVSAVISNMDERITSNT